MTFVNPYCGLCDPVLVAPGVVIDYSRPLTVVTYIDPSEVNDYPVGTPVASTDAITLMDRARDAFRRGLYDLALREANAAIALMPGDRALHEFRALVLFALTRYSEAAMTLNSILAVGPGWDWTTMIGLYPDVSVYTDQLRALEAYVRTNPRAPEGRFLLGYQYMTAGYTEAALVQFREVVVLAPKDRVAAQILETLAPPAESLEETPVPPTPEALASPESVETPTDDADALAGIQGTWKAQLPDGTRFTLTLRDDSTFAWVFRREGTESTITGTYTLGKQTLTLDDPMSGPMIGEIAFQEDGSWTFHMAGAPQGEGDLVFRR